MNIDNPDESFNGRKSLLLTWPPRLQAFPGLMTAVEACQYLRLDEAGVHTPQTAIRTLKYFRDRGQLKATKYARRVWFRKQELDDFLNNKTEPTRLEKVRRAVLAQIENLNNMENNHAQ